MEEELRKEAIRRHIIGGEEPKAIYTEINRSKKWFFKWLKRYRTGNTDWYKDISRAPVMRPRGTAHEEQELILSIRRRLESVRHAQIGVSAIKWELQKLGVHFPSDRTITRIIAREGLVKKNFVRAQGCGVSLFSGGAVLQ
ncbi:MAG: helix-turn-helix domain-containing protein [Deltaproteobacteria bacterium]|nr:helix-turn-helix domain-containing protein [Deltaproteobacteria bacterium]